jgi:hypothetical protein
LPWSSHFPLSREYPVLGRQPVVVNIPVWSRKSDGETTCFGFAAGAGIV